MEGLQNHYARSGSYLNDVHNVKGKKMYGGKSSSTPSALYSYEAEAGPGSQMVTKPKHTSWWNDPEKKRKRRVAKYKLYAVEGKLKHSVKKGLRWLKIKCIKIVRNL